MLQFIIDMLQNIAIIGLAISCIITNRKNKK